MGAQPRLDPVASVAQKLSVLLAAGVAPASAWSYLAEQPGDSAVLLQRVADGAAEGRPVVDCLLDAVAREPPQQGAAWRGIAAAWAVATDAGAPLAPTLRDLASALRSLAQVQRDVASALAAPRATARLVTALPLVGVLFGLGLGFDTLGTLFTTAPGIGCLVCGVLLMGAAAGWSRRLVAGAAPSSSTPGLALDLMSVAVSGGASLDRARAAVQSALDRCGVDDLPGPELDAVLHLSRRAGVPAAMLLRSAADEARREAASEGERKAATLSVTLMLPLGLCVLPAFMLLGVAPLMLAVISSTVTGA